jgi:MFS family permease
MSKVPWRPWKFVIWFGVASMLADVTYEGARSMTGAYLATLGASGALVGAVTGAGEAIGLSGRLVSGPLADKTRAYWGLALGGYVLTAVTVPLMGLTSILWIVCGLVLAERMGKALRRPAKDVMLSHATAAVGRGKGFAVHQAMDQVGAVVGPLAVAAVFAVTGHYAPAFAILAIPGLGVIVLLLWIRRSVPDPSIYEPALKRSKGSPALPTGGKGLGRPYWEYLAFATMTTVGYTTFGVLSFHLVHEKLVTSASHIAIIYAIAMGVDGLAALAAGALFDRWGRHVLIVVPLLAAAVPVLGFSSSARLAIMGIMVWSAIVGIQDSVMRAAVADLVVAERRGTAYGYFAGALGAAALVGGVMTGALYQTSRPLLIAVIGVVELGALVMYIVWARRLPVAVP